MDAVVELLQNYSLLEILLVVAILFCACKELYEAYQWFKVRLNNYYNKRNFQEKKEETIEERIRRLEEHDKHQYEKLEEVCKIVNDTNTFVKDYQKMQRQQNLATTRSILNSLYSESKKHGCLSQAEYETYAEIRDLYVSLGGNHHFAERVIPEMNALPIVEERNRGE